MDKNQLTNIHIKYSGSDSTERSNPFTFHSDSLSISHRNLKKDSVRGHFHDCFELEIALNGSAVNIINGSNYPLHKNSFYLLSPADIHKIEIDGDLELISIKFTDLLLPKELVNLLNTVNLPIVGEFSDSQSEDVLAPLLHLLSTSNRFSSDSYRHIYLRSLVELLLSVVLEQWQVSNESSVPSQTMLLLLSYVKKHFRENIPLNELARKYGYNTNYLRSKFRQLTGKTYVSFINDERLTYAYRLIELTDMQISEISDSTGYTSLSYFSRIFKAKYGISPANLRLTLKK